MNKKNKKEANQLTFTKTPMEHYVLAVTDSKGIRLGWIEYRCDERSHEYMYKAFDYDGDVLSDETQKLETLKQMFRDSYELLQEGAQKRAAMDQEMRNNSIPENPNTFQPDQIIDDDYLEPDLTDEQLRELRKFQLQYLRETGFGKDPYGIDR